MSDKLALASLLSWHLESGADVCLGEEPADHLRGPQAPPIEAPRPVPAAPPVAPLGQTVSGMAPQASHGEDSVRSARTHAAQCRTLEELEAAIDGFIACPLRATANKTVFSDGIAGSPLMLIGEAPGRDEDLEGRPFVGRSGQLLDKMLAAIGLDRHSEGRSVYIANVLPWRPPGNRAPTTMEAAMCLPFLERQIALARPKLLLLLGGAATKFLLSSEEGILRLRGTWRRWSSPEGELEIDAMPTLHPAFLLRQPGSKALAWRDLLAVREHLERIGHETATKREN